jgi:hypothetical protein
MSEDCGDETSPELEWVPILGYEGRYEINKQGAVRYVGSDTRVRLRNANGIKKTTLDRHGYVRVTLSKFGKNSQKLVHILLANAFLPKKEGDYLIDHVDGNKANNDLCNLRWGTQSVNQLNRHKLVASSGVTGVHFLKQSTLKPWMAVGKIGGRIIYLGTFESIEQARKARETWEVSVGCTTSANIRKQQEN